MSPLPPTAVSLTTLDRELESAERQLARLEARQQRWRQKQQQQLQYEDEDAFDVKESGYDAEDRIQDDDDDDNDAPTSVLKRLLRLQQTTDSLAVTHDFVQFLGTAEALLLQHPGGVLNDKDGHGAETAADSNNAASLLTEAQICYALSDQVLLKHGEIILDVCPAIYEETYQPLYRYVHGSLITMLRQTLQVTRYPHPDGCIRLLLRQQQNWQQQLLRQGGGCSNRRSRSNHDNDDTNSYPYYFLQVCVSVGKLERMHRSVVEAVEGIAAATVAAATNMTTTQQPNAVLLELLHPLLDRIHFHFVNAGVDDASDGPPTRQPRITATRIDRLPQWLLSYVRDNFLDLSHPSPYQLVLAIDSRLGPPFLHEIVRMVQWTFQQRRFFQDPAIAGPQSNPLLLVNAIEQFLEFDRTLQELAAEAAARRVRANDDYDDAAAGLETDRIMGLMDVLVVPNDDLMNWWMQRERESVFGTLFPDDDGDDNEDDNVYTADAHGDGTTAVRKPSANHVSPRAELFCALIRSVQLKAATLSAPSRYLRHVTVPLCSQFLEAVHQTSRGLLDLLVATPRRSHRSSSMLFASSTMISEAQLMANVHEWIEVINGTQLAARILLTKERTWYVPPQDSDGRGGTSKVGSSQSDHDLARLGRSMERLAEAMIADFASTFVETVVMERARFASYLMMASHLLASQVWETDGDDDIGGQIDDDLSVELKDTKAVLQCFHKVCNSILGSNGMGRRDEDRYNSDDATRDIGYFAPLAMRAQVMDRVGDKFLEVALDLNHVTPEIWLHGASLFARDVRNVMGWPSSSSAASSSSSPASSPWTLDIPSVHRLMEVTKLMTVEYRILESLRAALGGLVGAEPDSFLILEEFVADTTLHEEAVSMLKAKHVHCPLEDAISILNRRRN